MAICWLMTFSTFYMYSFCAVLLVLIFQVPMIEIKKQTKNNPKLSTKTVL